MQDHTQLTLTTASGTGPAMARIITAYDATIGNFQAGHWADITPDPYYLPLQQFALADLTDSALDPLALLLIDQLHAHYYGRPGTPEPVSKLATDAIALDERMRARGYTGPPPGYLRGAATARTLTQAMRPDEEPTDDRPATAEAFTGPQLPATLAALTDQELRGFIDRVQIDTGHWLHERRQRSLLHEVASLAPGDDNPMRALLEALDSERRRRLHPGSSPHTLPAPAPGAS